MDDIRGKTDEQIDAYIDMARMQYLKWNKNESSAMLEYLKRHGHEKWLEKKSDVIGRLIN